MTTAVPKWRAESVPDEYSTQDRVWYGVATDKLDVPVFYFDDEQNAAELAAYLNALETRVARAEAALREIIDTPHATTHCRLIAIAHDALDQGAQEETDA